MKPQLLSLLFVLAMQPFLLAQDCLPNGIVFSNQAAINNFHTNYPGCTKIGGFVSMHGNDIQNLQGLSGITEIGGSLIIDSTLISNFQGLNSLKKIGGSLQLSYNINLDHFNGLDSLTTIVGNISATFTGVQNFMGMPQIASIGGLSLYFTGTKNMDGLEGVQRIKSSIVLRNCFELNNIKGLMNVKSINGDIWIELTSLTSLSGLDSINPSSIYDLSITSNDFLSECDVASICSYLAAPGGNVMIEYNAMGCKTEAEVLEACITSAPELANSQKQPIAFPNPATDQVNFQLGTNDGIMEVMLLNALGQQLIHMQGPVEKLDITGLQNGYYILLIKTNSKTIREKLVKH